MATSELQQVLKQVDGGLPTELWVAPPTKMDEHQLTEEGIYNIFGTSGARTEMPGCSCIGNPKRGGNQFDCCIYINSGPNRLGQGADVFLASSELAAVSAALGKDSTMSEYLEYMSSINTMSENIYRYLNFNEIEEIYRGLGSRKKCSFNQRTRCRIKSRTQEVFVTKQYFFCYFRPIF